MNRMQKANLTCKECNARIAGFLSDTLSDKEAERFVRHVQTCTHCFENLETEFMVDRAVAYLNQDLPIDTSFDMRPLLRKTLREKEKTLRSKRRINAIRTVILVLTLLLIALLILDLTGIFHVTVFLAS